jgi:hypothetical protein
MRAAAREGENLVASSIAQEAARRQYPARSGLAYRRRQHVEVATALEGVCSFAGSWLLLMLIRHFVQCRSNTQQPLCQQFFYCYISCLCGLGDSWEKAGPSPDGDRTVGATLQADETE